MKRINFKKLSKLNWILILLLILAIAYIIFQPSLNELILNRNSKSNSIAFVPKADTNYTKFFNRVDELISSTNNKKDFDNQKLNFIDFLSILKQNEMPTISSYERYLSKKNIPADMKYFFSFCLSNYISSQSNGFSKIIDKDIIFSTNTNLIKEIKILFNSDQKTTETFINQISKKENTIILSGTYTSPLSVPAGLAINKAVIINPFIQNWDGLLIISPQNNVLFQNIKRLNYNNRNFNITNNANDFREFINVTSKENLQIIQSHLLINSDSIIVEDDASKGKARRRVIFETTDNGLHIYDSQDKLLTLFEVAVFIRNNFHAVNALNLDMGDYNFCRIYKNGNMTKDYSTFSKTKSISNFIVIEF